MKLSIDTSQRYGKMRAHTATHLLHSELCLLFPHTKQAWSLVDSDYLRFDFYADRLLGIDEIKHIEQSINTIIYKGYTVTIEEMPIHKAIDKWAKAFFEDKYGDIVRTVSIWSTDDISWTTTHTLCSFELCGWTHVAHTREIGWFTIIDQQAVASGIKRITAVTGPKLIDCIHKQSDQLMSIAHQLQCTVGQLDEKISKILSEHTFNSSLVDSFKHLYLQSQFTWSWEYIVNEKLVTLKDIQSYIKKTSLDYKLIVQLGESFLIYDPAWEAKNIMNQKGWTWWGSETLCQWKR